MGGALSIVVGYLRWGREDVGKAAETAAQLIDTMRGVNKDIEDAMLRLQQERDETRAERDALAKSQRKCQDRVYELERRLEAADDRAALLEAEINRLESLLDGRGRERKP
jgi:chromosome segregation ATPase